MALFLCPPIWKHTRRVIWLTSRQVLFFFHYSFDLMTVDRNWNVHLGYVICMIETRNFCCFFQGNGAVQKGMPHKSYHGRTGVVYNITPHAVGVIVNKRVRSANSALYDRIFSNKSGQSMALVGKINNWLDKSNWQYRSCTVLSASISIEYCTNITVQYSTGQYDDNFNACHLRRLFHASPLVAVFWNLYLEWLIGTNVQW